MSFSPTYSVGFTVAQGLGSGSITVTLTNNLGGLGIAESNVEVAVAVSSPAGIVRPGGVFGVGGNIHPDVSYSVSYPLPVDMTGLRVLGGIYTVEVLVRISGGVEPGDWRGGPTESELCIDCIPEIRLEPQVDCLRAQVTATDLTPWTQSGWTVSSRLMTLKYPGGFDHADITSTSSVVTTGVEQIPDRGTWTALLAVTATKTPVTISFTATKEIQSNCPVGTCELACLIRSAYDNWRASGHPSDKAKWETTVAYAGMIMNEIRCGADNSALNEYATRLKAELGLNSSGKCGCDDCGGVMVPLLPVSQSPVWTAGYGIDITGDVISINTTVQNILASFRLEEVVSTDGSVTVAATTPSPGVRQFNLSVTKPTDYIEFAWEVVTNGGFPSINIVAEDIKGTFFKSPTITENTGSKLYVVSDFLTVAADSVFNVSIGMAGRELTTSMVAADRHSSIIDARLYFGQWANSASYPSGSQLFNFGLIPIGPSLGNLLGSSQLASWYSGVLLRFAVRIRITKAQ